MVVVSVIFKNIYRNFDFMQIIKPKFGWGEVKVIWEVLPTTQIETLSMQST